MAPAHTIWVAAAVVREAGRVLLAQRLDGDSLAGFWEFPGGKIEPGEDPREAVARELREELGIDVRVGEVLGLSFLPNEQRAVTLLFFEAERTPTSLEPQPLQAAAVRWVPLADLCDSELTPGDRGMAAKLRSGELRAEKS